ncbi:UDP-glucosyltransferase 2-like [Homalodisca vitripennis]|nr:UDP-glucosyltransferase 2-like [Homalodisca vitripennis]XP_046662639.1 UDP-glucosyltransferase 2-like [Homalodisca vitripennis]XP_046662640.1 UDP-glucosyltransferase 2-like [Homalodisca vitripennis]
MYLGIVVACLTLVWGCDGARILGLAAFSMRSHWIVMEPLFEELAARGHNVTVFSSFPRKKLLPNYTDIDFSDRLKPIMNEFSVEMLRKRVPNPWATTFFFRDVHGDSCKVLDEPEYQDLLKAHDQYDIVITELFGSDCFAYYAYKLKIPMIAVTTSMAMPWAADRFGLPDNPSYILNYFQRFSPNMNFWERIYNTVTLLYGKFWHLWIFSRETQAMVEKSFREPLPPVSEVVANTSMYFINSYHALLQSRPFPPNVIEIGGIHIKKKKPLPKDLQDILDNAKNGVIVMSFGSLVRAATLPKPIIMMFMKVFSKIPQTVIFKYEEDLPEAPPNVVIRKWLSQRDLIEHENVIAVIQHGGLSSTIEAVHFGKPMIGVPFFADQKGNIKHLERRDTCIQLDFDNLSEETISRAVSEIINNPKYRDNMRRLSLQFRDRPMTALQSAVYWTEYVIRHHGAPHLQPASVHLPFYQYLLLDVIAVFIVSLVVLTYAIYYIISRILAALKCNPVKSAHKVKNSKKIN